MRTLILSFTTFILLLAPCVYAQTSWPAKTWVLDCPRTEHNGDTVDLSACCTSVNLEEWMCDAENPASPTAAVQHQLEDASVYFEQLGFKAPEVDMDGRPPYEDDSPYMFALGGDSLLVENDLVYGYYENSEPGGTLVVDSEHYFQISGTDNNTATPTHELFHGIQAAYPFYDNTSTEWRWIVEGTASAAEATWLKQTNGGYGEGFWPFPWPLYDYPLHRPRNYQDSLQPYATGHFWAGLGKLLNHNPSIRVLAQLFETMPGTMDDLSSVDIGLIQLDTDGLYDLYPEFIAEFVQRNQFFEHVDNVGFIAYDEETTEGSVKGTVKEVATNAHELSLILSGDEMARLIIEFETDHEDLHLIVGDTRYDSSSLLGSRNRFETIVTEDTNPERFFIRVANIAEEPKESISRDYTLNITLEPIFAEWTATVGVGPYAGTYVGESAYAFWGQSALAGLQVLTLKGVNAGPAPYFLTMISFMGEGYDEPGTYTPERGFIELNFSKTDLSGFATSALTPGADVFYLNHGGPDPNPNPNLIPMQDSNPPVWENWPSKPITLVFDDLSEDRVKGSITGSFWHIEEPGQAYHHPEVRTGSVRGNVSISFDVVPCTREKRRRDAEECTE